MSDIKTNYAGLSLKNPFIVSSCGLTDDAQKNKKLSDAGAGAIVLKSIFEEQIMMKADKLYKEYNHTEANDYLFSYCSNHSLSKYIELISKSKEICDVPIIANINCFSNDVWGNFAEQIEKAGADALEINILSLQTDKDYTDGSFEQQHIDILKMLKKTVNIPIIMKLGINFTNPVALIEKLKANGANAVVLFNRFYQPDIDIEKQVHTTNFKFSCPSDFSRTLRWTGIVSSKIHNMDIAASGGISTPEDTVKTILAGASAVEISSELYKRGESFIKETTDFLSSWMSRKGYKNIDEFKGKLNISHKENINTFERTQFIKYFKGK